jgi:dienelactone hydrolase
MLIMMIRYFCMLGVLLYPSVSLTYSDNYEKRIAKQLVEGPTAQEVLWSEVSGREFVMLYQGYHSEQVKGALIILHQMGAHPDWPQVINPIRTRLPDLGWATLSIQLPVLSPEQAIADYGLTLNNAKRRVRAAVKLLRKRGFLNIIVIGHSFGAATAANALSDNDLKDVKAFVGISMQAPQFLSPRLKLLKQLQAIDIPILDIYGSDDNSKILREVDDRRLAAQKNANESYQQVSIEGAGHYFTGFEDVLVRRMNDWMTRTSEGTAAMVNAESVFTEQAKQAPKSGE